MIPLAAANIARQAAGALGAAAPAAITALSPEARLERKTFREQAKKLRANQLGLSSSAQRGIAAEAAANAQAAAKGTESELLRAQAAGGMQSGSQAQQILELQKGINQASAAGATGAANLSAQMAASEKAAILAESRRRRGDKLAVAQSVFAPKAKPEDAVAHDATGLKTLFGGQ